MHASGDLWTWIVTCGRELTQLTREVVVCEARQMHLLQLVQRLIDRQSAAQRRL